MGIRTQEGNSERREYKQKLTLSNLGPTKGLLDDDVASWKWTCQSRRRRVYVQCSPLGPRVTETAFASTSTPLRMDALPSLENLISL